ncbi:MAG: HPr family phosphocarrier protein [Rhodospirillaceae bacterium]|nr:HPr family phosphocarrier protein [Rhodospirillaceae bacterium]MBT5298419.1 HPr family phosphocarrier protein [Rhodospirillaceae bacterium]MBT5512748.1 HPr family phosphocarrier protein [Rhodospirillaceae bacterium]MBT6084153.1 HPr family phosphocarrier protein [Rhodospirillaceae bacterium]MBT6609753.1 HPr family phosphocarrier protein [Rhodospirillaceae bacterium]
MAGSGRIVGTVSRASTICNQRGLHARAAAKFVQLAGGFESEITVTRGGQSVSGSSIMGLMMLAAGPGTEIQLSATGGDAKAALDAICALIEDRFQED